MDYEEEIVLVDALGNPLRESEPLSTFATSTPWTTSSDPLSDIRAAMNEIAKMPKAPELFVDSILQFTDKDGNVVHCIKIMSDALGTNVSLHPSPKEVWIISQQAFREVRLKLGAAEERLLLNIAVTPQREAARRLLERLTKERPRMRLPSMGYGDDCEYHLSWAFEDRRYVTFSVEVNTDCSIEWFFRDRAKNITAGTDDGDEPQRYLPEVAKLHLFREFDWK